MTTNAQGVPHWKSLRVAHGPNSADDWALLLATTLLYGSQCGGRHLAQKALYVGRS
jgi:hypothetical protein